MIPAMPALIPASNRNTMMQASHMGNNLEEIEAKISKELRYQSDIVKVSEETLKAEREKLEKLEKEYAIIRDSMRVQNSLFINQENPIKRLRVNSPNSLNRKKEQELKTKEQKPASSLAMPSGAFRPFSRTPHLQKFRSFWTTRLSDEEEMESKNKCGQINIEELVAEEIEKRRFKSNDRKS